jgi:hypothetical protein
MQVSNFILEGLMQIVVAYINAYIRQAHRSRCHHSPGN